MPRLEDLNEIERQGVLNFPFEEHDESPSVPMRKPLAESRLALVTTAGVHLRTDKPFFHGDPSYRVIPSRSLNGDILQSHVSIGFDRTPIYRDLNVSFPIDRLSELNDQEKIGSLGENYYSFMGAQRNPRQIVAETGPEVAERLKSEGVEAVLLTPT